jgi:hypothetical protein
MGRAGRISRRRLRKNNLPATRTPVEWCREITLNMMKNLRLALDRLLKQVCLVSKTIANAGKQRQRQLILNQREAERLDRILNPSKYRGK